MFSKDKDSGVVAKALDNKNPSRGIVWQGVVAKLLKDGLNP